MSVIEAHYTSFRTALFVIYCLSKNDFVTVVLKKSRTLEFFVLFFMLIRISWLKKINKTKIICFKTAGPRKQTIKDQTEKKQKCLLILPAGSVRLFCPSALSPALSASSARQLCPLRRFFPSVFVRRLYPPKNDNNFLIVRPLCINTRGQKATLVLLPILIFEGNGQE